MPLVDRIKNRTATKKVNDADKTQLTKDFFKSETLEEFKEKGLCTEKNFMDLVAKVKELENELEETQAKYQDIKNTYETFKYKGTNWRNTTGRPTKIFDAGDIQGIINHKKMGHSNYAIAEMYDVSEATIRRILKANNYTEEKKDVASNDVKNAIKKALYNKTIHEKNLIKNKLYHRLYKDLQAGEVDILGVPKSEKEIENMEQLTWDYENFNFFLNETSPNGTINVELNKTFIDSFDIGYVVCDHMDFKEACKKWLENNEGNYTKTPKNDSRGIVDENKDGSSHTSYDVKLQKFKI